MLELKVSSKIYNAELFLERRITYIRGDSGTGKTSLFYMLNQYRSNVSGITVECRLRIRLLEEMPSIEELNVIKDSVLVFDDNLASEYDMGIFNDLCPKNNLYLIIINRVDSSESKNSPKIDFAVSSILISKENGVKHSFLPVCNSMFNQNWSTDLVDLILTEDTYGLYSMDSILGIPCETSKGKDNIINKLEELKSLKYKNILVCADWSSYGRNFNDFYVYCSSSELNILVDFNYECFEYMILVSNMIKENFIFNKDIANSYPSWEKYFESELEKITKKKFYKYIHGKELRDCYRVDCSESYCNKFIKDICEKYYEGSKIDFLFKGTIFEYMRLLGKGRESE